MPDTPVTSAYPATELTAIADRALDVIENDVLPLTRLGVVMGNKVFGAALLRKSDLTLVLAETNNEMESPLHHGEMHLLKRYHELPAARRPSPKDMWFISTHEPCSMCMSAITWAGFDNFWYFFSHEDSRDAFAIPHDLKIFHEVFRLEPGGYARKNSFWIARSIRDHASEARGQQVKRLALIYDELSALYQSGKAANAIPLR
ncbi:MAG: nucleoside deaminase [Rhizobiaceae bacterium]|jgi:tRNA(Arg) A34 adenosine deaminase TadA|nr:nucleoside deaminase [Rhizobiaceae bacterium]